MSETLELEFGATAPDLFDQIHRQHKGYIHLQDLGHLQKDADAVTRLAVRYNLPERVRKSIRQRIVKAAVKACTAPRELK